MTCNSNRGIPAKAPSQPSTDLDWYLQLWHLQSIYVEHSVTYVQVRNLQVEGTIPVLRFKLKTQSSSRFFVLLVDRNSSTQTKLQFWEFTESRTRTRLLWLFVLISWVLFSQTWFVTGNLSLAGYVQGESYLFLESEVCQECSAPILWPSCELLTTLYEHHYLTCQEILLDCSNIFPRRSPMLLLRSTCYLYLFFN